MIYVVIDACYGSLAASLAAFPDSEVSEELYHQL